MNTTMYPHALPVSANIVGPFDPTVDALVSEDDIVTYEPLGWGSWAKKIYKGAKTASQVYNAARPFLPFDAASAAMAQAPVITNTVGPFDATVDPSVTEDDVVVYEPLGFGRWLKKIHKGVKTAANVYNTVQPFLPQSHGAAFAPQGTYGGYLGAGIGSIAGGLAGLAASPAGSVIGAGAGGAIGGALGHAYLPFQAAPTYAPQGFFGGIAGKTLGGWIGNRIGGSTGKTIGSIAGGAAGGFLPFDAAPAYTQVVPMYAGVNGA